TTAEVLRAYQLLGAQNSASYSPALSFLNADPEQNAEFIARKIPVDTAAGFDVQFLTNSLVTRQNPDGGFGDQPGYDSSVLDTAYALQALGAIGYNSGTIVPAAVGYLLRRQDA